MKIKDLPTQNKQTTTSLKRKVFVALSGGVDSSVAAALLKRDGFDVTGIYMKCWTEGAACTAQDDERSARMAASRLGIPFYSWNFLKEYAERVTAYMTKGYEEGITPNPDAVCNREIKFGLFFEKAMALGADFVATGHYARVRGGLLQEAKDKEKDQSYFLSLIKPEVLPRVLFPIGEYTKAEVRAVAASFGLPNAQRKSSQGLCFVGKVHFDDFLKQYIPSQKGEIRDPQGTLLGFHEGVMYYTIGQRQGIGLSGGPYFVLRKDRISNILTVTKNEEDLLQSEILLTDMHWFYRGEENVWKGQARIRYRQPLVQAKSAQMEDGTWKMFFEEPQRAPAPGQVVALYGDGLLVASGIIQESASFSMPSSISFAASF